MKMEHGWIRVAAICRVEDASAVDDALEAVGLIHVARDGEDHLCVVACGSLQDLCSARMACASIPFDSVSREDLELVLQDLANAARAESILSQMPWINAEAVVVRMLRVYLRDEAILGRLRAEMVTRLGRNAVAVEVG